MDSADACGLGRQHLQIVEGVAEQLPLPDCSQDAVVATLVSMVSRRRTGSSISRIKPECLKRLSTAAWPGGPEVSRLALPSSCLEGRQLLNAKLCAVQITPCHQPQFRSVTHTGMLSTAAVRRTCHRCCPSQISQISIVVLAQMDAPPTPHHWHSWPHHMHDDAPSSRPVNSPPWPWSTPACRCCAQWSSQSWCCRRCGACSSQAGASCSWSTWRRRRAPGCAACSGC